MVQLRCDQPSEAYLLKGGFLWVDDFWGSDAWRFWRMSIGQVLGGYPIKRLPDDHPILTTPHRLPDGVPQVPNLNFWRTNRYTTSERGADSVDVNVMGIEDRHGRLMVLMTHNTDIGDTWERESHEGYFYAFAVDGYSLAMNILAYAMSH